MAGKSSCSRSRPFRHSLSVPCEGEVQGPFSNLHLGSDFCSRFCLLKIHNKYSDEKIHDAPKMYILATFPLLMLSARIPSQIRSPSWDLRKAPSSAEGLHQKVDPSFVFLTFTTGNYLCRQSCAKKYCLIFLKTVSWRSGFCLDETRNANKSRIVFFCPNICYRLGLSLSGASPVERGNVLTLGWSWSPSQAFCFLMSLQRVWTPLQPVLLCFSSQGDYLILESFIKKSFKFCLQNNITF